MAAERIPRRVAAFHRQQSPRAIAVLHVLRRSSQRCSAPSREGASHLGLAAWACSRSNHVTLHPDIRMECSHFRRPDRARGRHPQPHAAGARAPRADGFGAVRGPAAAAIHGQPAPQDAARRRVGLLAARRHEPLLHAGARRPRAGDAAAVGAAPRAGEPDAGRRPGRPATPRRSRPAAEQVAGVLRIRGGAVGSRCARTCSAARRYLQALPGLLDPEWVVGDLGCGTGQVAAALAPFVNAGDRRRSLGRHAAGGAPPRHAIFPTSTCGAASSRRCRSRTPRSTPRRCCSCCTTCRIPSRRSREAARVLRPGGRLLISDMLPHDREDVSPADGPRLARIRRGRSCRSCSETPGSIDVRIASLPSRIPTRKGRRCSSQARDEDS